MIKNTLLTLTIVGSLVWLSSCNVEDTVNDAIEQCADIELTCDDTKSYTSCVNTDGITYEFDGTTYDELDDLTDATAEYCDSI